MTRAERRRAERVEKKAKTATYNLTEAQLDALIREKLQGQMDELKNRATEDAVNTAMILTLSIPLKVLMDHYWTKSYEKRLPEFTNYVLEYFTRWQDGELDIEELRRDLWEYGGVKLVEEGKEDGNSV